MPDPETKEGLPADIVAAIEAAMSAAFLHGMEVGDGTGTEHEAGRKEDVARAALDDAILAHLSGKQEDDAAGRVSGEAYQIIGTLAEAAGLFDDPAVIRALDYFAKQEWRTGAEILPWSPEAGSARREVLSRLDEKGEG